MPSCAATGASIVNIAFGTIQDAGLSFTYSAASVVPTITSLNASSSNPALKTILEIHGTGFGSDSSVAKVFLANATGKIYQLRIITYSDILIKVGLSGGLTGTYKVQVTIPTASGDSIANPIGADTFDYVNSITSIAPLTGSYYGGTLITITGTNFIP